MIGKKVACIFSESIDDVFGGACPWGVYGSVCVLQVPHGTASMCTIRAYAYGLSDDWKTAVCSSFRVC